jgi:hypothetical protein
VLLMMGTTLNNTIISQCDAAVSSRIQSLISECIHLLFLINSNNTNSFYFCQELVTHADSACFKFVRYDTKIYYHRNGCKNMNTKSDTATDYVNYKNHRMSNEMRR